MHGGLREIDLFLVVGLLFACEGRKYLWLRYVGQLDRVCFVGLIKGWPLRP